MAKEIHFPESSTYEGDQLNRLLNDNILVGKKDFEELVSDRQATRIGFTVATILYFGLGAASHAHLYGPTLELNNAWTWAFLTAWPAMLFVALIKAIWPFLLLIATAIAVIIVAKAIWRGLRWLWVLAREANDRRRKPAHGMVQD